MVNIKQYIVYVRSEDNDIMNVINIKLIDYREHKRMYRKMGKEGGRTVGYRFRRKSGNY